MSLKLSNKVTLISAFGAAILSALLFIAIKEWYSPDIRYEEGAYYISGSNAITYLKMINYGHSDSEGVVINARFIDKINNISIEDKTLTFNYLSGGLGSKDVVIKIDRIVPSYELVIYFSMNYSPEINNIPSTFISNIIFKGGRGKTGRPVGTLIVFLIGIFLIFSSIGSLLGIKLARRIITKMEKLLKTQFIAQLQCLVTIIYSIDKEKLPPELIRLLEKMKRGESAGIEESWNELCNICKLLDLRKNQ